MALWPIALPDPKISGYGLNPVDPIIRTDMEGGNVRTRRRSTARLDKVSVLWSLSDAEFALFRGWYDDAVSGINGGSSWFTCSLAVGTSGTSVVEARFTAIWQAKPMPGLQYWDVTATLEVRYA